jgi:uncharacterized protein YuzE
MPTETAHATEFPVFNRSLPRPVEVMRLLAKGGLPLTMARSIMERVATLDVKGRYYHQTDTLYIEIAPGATAQTRVVANGLKVDLSADGNLIGFDIDNSSRLGALLRDFIASRPSIEDLARAWASRDDKRDSSDKEEGLSASDGNSGDYLDYFAEIEEVLQRAAKYAVDRSAISSSSSANR